MDDRAAEIWRSYAEALAGLADVVADTPIELDEVTRAEGLRHLARILYMGMLSVHDYGATTDPKVFLAKTPTQLTGGVTSDCIYYESFFDGGRTHRLHGTRGSAPLLEITVIAGKIGVTETGSQVDTICEDTLVVEPGNDGERFEIVLSPEPRPADNVGNWLRTDHPERGRATYMIIRQYSPAISEVIPARIEIDPVGDDRHRPPLTLDEIEEALHASVSFTDILVRHWAAMTAGMITGLTNRFLIVDEAAAADEPMPSGHRFSTAGFHLSPDEAWVVTIPGVGAPPYDAAPYWGFQLCNYWFEPLDYGDQWAHRNNTTVRYDADGTVRLVVSEQRPGPDHDANWIQLRGHSMGNAQFRLSRIAAPLPRIECEVVDVADLR
jgi:hypothetical protein